MNRANFSFLNELIEELFVVIGQHAGQVQNALPDFCGKI
jgi:hypothetical protein